MSDWSKTLGSPRKRRQPASLVRSASVNVLSGLSIGGEEGAFPALDEENRELEALLKKGQSELRKTEDELGKLDARLEPIGSHLEGTRSQLRQVKELAKAKGQELETEKHLARMADQSLKRTDKEAKAAKADIAKLEERISLLEKRLTKGKMEAEKLKASREVDPKALDAVRESVREKDELKSTIERYMAVDSRAVHDMEAELRRIELEVGKQRRELDEWERELAALGGRRRGLQADIKAAQKERHTVMAQWEAVVKREAQATESVQSLRSQLTEMTAATTARRSVRFASPNKPSGPGQASKEQLSLQLNSQQSKLDGLRASRKDLEDKLARAETLCAGKQKEAGEVEAQVRALREHVRDKAEEKKAKKSNKMEAKTSKKQVSRAMRSKSAHSQEEEEESFGNVLSKRIGKIDAVLVKKNKALAERKEEEHKQKETLAGLNRQLKTVRAKCREASRQVRDAAEKEDEMARKAESVSISATEASSNVSSIRVPGMVGSAKGQRGRKLELPGQGAKETQELIAELAKAIKKAEKELEAARRRSSAYRGAEENTGRAVSEAATEVAALEKALVKLTKHHQQSSASLEVAKVETERLRAAAEVKTKSRQASKSPKGVDALGAEQRVGLASSRAKAGQSELAKEEAKKRALKVEEKKARQSLEQTRRKFTALTDRATKSMDRERRLEKTRNELAEAKQILEQKLHTVQSDSGKLRNTLTMIASKNKGLKEQILQAATPKSDDNQERAELEQSLSALYARLKATKTIIAKTRADLAAKQDEARALKENVEELSSRGSKPKPKATSRNLAKLNDYVARELEEAEREGRKGKGKGVSKETLGWPKGEFQYASSVASAKSARRQRLSEMEADRTRRLAALEVKRAAAEETSGDSGVAVEEAGRETPAFDHVAKGPRTPSEAGSVEPRSETSDERSRR